MRTVFIAVLFVALAAAPIYADTNMVYNSGFEAGDFSGWGTWGTEWTGSGSHDGDYAAYSWIGAGGWQDIAISDPLQPLKISGWLADSAQDPLNSGAYVSFRLEFKDSSDSKIWQWESDKVYGTGSGLSWTEISDFATPGAGAVKATLVWETQGSGNGTGRFDSFSVSAVPEPVSTALFLVGGATLAVRRLRRKKG
ncbi:MAG: PEP-CTERM sorting domain-containing protein [Candidatus Omnitrophota bacterium]|jgi:hypothetical protein